MASHDRTDEPDLSAPLPEMSEAELQKNLFAEAVSSIARSVKESADSLSPQIAGFVRSTADAVEKAGSSVQDQDISEFVESVGDFAAKRPVVFVGCGILAGVLIGRLFQSSGK